MQQLLLFPYSGTSIEALDCLGSQWECIGFISDDVSLVGQEKFGIPVYDRSALTIFSEAKVLALHGSPTSFRKRLEILTELNVTSSRFATVIHPKAYVSSRAKLGFNVLVMAGVIITSNATIGNHTIILPNTVVHHDSIISDLTLIAANVTIAGNVHIGRNCYIGAASSIKNGISLGEKVLLGMGANVVHSFPDELTLIGNPAKPLIY